MRTGEEMRSPSFNPELEDFLYLPVAFAFAGIAYVFSLLWLSGGG